MFQGGRSYRWYRALVQGLRTQLNEGWPEAVVRSLRTARVATLDKELPQPVRRASPNPCGCARRPEIGGAPR